MNLYNKLLKEKKLEIAELEDKLSQAKLDLTQLELDYIQSYKSQIVRKYLKLWNNDKINPFPRDDELTHAIFFLGGLKDQSEKHTPKIKINKDKDDNIHVYYFNHRLGIWVELTNA